MNYKHFVEGIRYRGRTTKLRAPLVWARHWKINRNDAFVASYPRSGNTWSRFLLCEALTETEADFRSVPFTIPAIRLHSLYGAIPAVLPNRGRLLRTHELYSRAYRKAVYFVRDPRDVVISNYEFERGFPHFRAKTFDDFLHLFDRGKINSFGSWRAHVRSWLDSPLAQTDDFLLIRYEDMRRDTEGLLAKIIEFLAVPVNPERVRIAVENNDLQRMRQKEDRSRGWSADCGAAMEAGRQVRVGSVGGWQDRLSPAQVDLIEHHAGDLMMRLGYPLHKETKIAICESTDVVSSELLRTDLIH